MGGKFLVNNQKQDLVVDRYTCQWRF